MSETEKKMQQVLVKKTYERKVTLGTILTQYDSATHGTSIEMTIEVADSKELAAKLSGIGDLIVGATEKEIEKNIEKLRKQKEEQKNV